jgi:uncharacterized protein YukE
MSGPKIVDIRLVQAMQERHRRLARKRFEQLQQQWKAQRQRIRAALGTASPMVDADEIKGIEQSIRDMDQRLAQLGEQASLEELISCGAEGLAFMDAELNRLQQKINSALLEARQRARSLRWQILRLASGLRAWRRNAGSFFRLPRYRRSNRRHNVWHTMSSSREIWPCNRLLRSWVSLPRPGNSYRN